MSDMRPVFHITRNRSGDLHWYHPSQRIAVEHDYVREATPEEAALMHRIYTSGSPSLADGERVQRMMRDTQERLDA